ncbi:hypothetical protein BH11MYX3_BH11MYX3_21150 [soil metagenome]
MTPVDRAIAITTTLLLFHAAPARAQSAEAEVLFRDGRALIKQGKLVQGCGKIEASERLESSVGTLLNLGDCREKQGKLATAWAAFKKAEATAKNSNDKRFDEARRRAATIEPLMPSLTIDVPTIPDGLIVKRNNEPVDIALLNIAVPVDPGTYVVTAEAPGFKAWRADVVIQYKAKRHLAIPPLTRGSIVIPSRTPVESGPVAVHTTRSVWTPWRKLSVGLAVIGVGAAGTGFYFGMRARDLEGKANQRCPLTVCADPVALKDNADARENARRANILYIAGGVAVASSVALWFIGGPSESTVVRPTFSAGQAGVSVAGRF